MDKLKYELKKALYVTLIPCALFGGITGMIKLGEEGKDYVKQDKNQVQVRETYGVGNPVVFTRDQNGDELDNPVFRTKMHDKNLDGRVDCIIVNNTTVQRTTETESEFQKADEKWKKYFEDMGIEKAIGNWEYLKKNGETQDNVNKAISDF